MNASKTSQAAKRQDIDLAAEAARGMPTAALPHPAAPETLAQRADRVAAVAAQYAATVDAESRFPAEAITAARAERLMGIMVPRELGGEGAGIADVTDVCYTLGRACALDRDDLRHASDQGRVRGAPRQIQRLASVAAAPAVQRADAAGVLDHRGPGRRRRAQQRRADRCGTVRASRSNAQATVISYGEAADGIVTTARRSADAASSDQVLAVFLKPDYTLEPTCPAGTRSACAAPAAPASTCKPRAAAPSRSCR